MNKLQIRKKLEALSYGVWWAYSSDKFGIIVVAVVSFILGAKLF